MLTFEINNLVIETIRLQFQPNLRDKIMSFLDSLPSKEVEITLEDAQFEINKLEVHRQYNAFKNGECKIYSIEEVEDMLFDDNKQRVQNSYENLKNGKSQLYDIEDLDFMLDELNS